MSIAEREVRVRRLWRKFSAEMVRQGLATSEHLAKFESYTRQAAYMRRCLAKGLPAGFRLGSALLAVDIGVEPQQLAAPHATRARPGSREKISILRRRYESGMELHGDDFAVVDSSDVGIGVWGEVRPDGRCSAATARIPND
jgi:hypothetical protein